MEGDRTFSNHTKIWPHILCKMLNSSILLCYSMQASSCDGWWARRVVQWSSRWRARQIGVIEECKDLRQDDFCGPDEHWGLYYITIAYCHGLVGVDLKNSSDRWYYAARLSSYFREIWLEFSDFSWVIWQEGEIEQISIKIDDK